MLLVLDNCEHVTKAAANLADAILAHSQKITVIATSRELLSVTGEHVMQIEPLDIDGASSPATQLFLERARAVSPKLSVRDDDISVKAICAELEGIPLAIELAAARAKSMSLEQIHQRLNQRFRLLTGGSKALKRERHHTLHNAVQWSYDLLEDDEKKVFKRISVFAGGFTLEAAEIVSAGDDIDSFDVVDLLDSLVSKSLVVVTRSEDNLRYRMLETIRAYGAEQLEATGDAFDVRAAHATFFSREADANFKVWRSKDQLQAHRWLDAEINNLRSAFTWAMEQDQVDPAARIASSVGDLARFALIEEAANWAELVVEKALSVRHPRSVILLTWSASSAWAASRFEDAQRFGSQALELLQDPHYEPFVWAYGDLAFVAIFSGDVPKAIKLLAEGAGHPVDAHDRMMMTFHLYIMATAGFAEDARLIADDVVRKVDAAGVPMSIAVAHAARGAALEAIDPESALKEYEYGIEVASSSGARFMETLIAPRLASLHVTAGAPQTALEGFERMLLAYGETTDMACVSAWRASLVILLEKTGQFQAAATLHGTLVGLIDQSSVVPAHKEAIDRVMTALGTRGFSSAVESGAAMSMRDAANYAISQVRLGLAVAA